MLRAVATDRLLHLVDLGLADSRVYGGFLEQRRRAVRVALIASAAFALLSLVAVLLQPRPERLAGHAYPIPMPTSASGSRS